MKRPDQLTAFFNPYMEEGTYCWYDEENNRIVISDVDDTELEDFDLDTFQAE
jgi:hypothetical protein